MKQHTKSLRHRLPCVIVLTALTLLTGTGLASAQQQEPQGTPPGMDCAQGEFCMWSEEFHSGEIARHDLRNTNPEECVALPEEMDAKSFVNRTDRYVTVYQDRDCATEGDFSTYPGDGTFVPQAPFAVRAIQIWD
ncbi:Peptidase inhibitor family I36 [Amycolatopsis marina]|uniref:Peptidase inhibitor family I36 n=1 Tax=Amycolatopsis marina TaxID=490629 RepID=A0A1I0ZKK1_9PSEU|nr:peptidase inhibitor family I36 protein [Amycolatopsis marina]SFB26174.1 Peptidase inhibitor family I36 [Amycolatopsis marina]